MLGLFDKNKARAEEASILNDATVLDYNADGDSFLNLITNERYGSYMAADSSRGEDNEEFTIFLGTLSQIYPERTKIHTALVVNYYWG